jgi:hypothetical protein
MQFHSSAVQSRRHRTASLKKEGQMSPVELISAAIIATAPLQADAPIMVQGANCYAIGEQQAADVGGALASADEAVRNGQAVCRIVIVVPAKNGERARRVELVVPKG